MEPYTLISLQARCLHTEAGCWQWDGKRDRSGYGRTTRSRVTMSVHRLAYSLAHGPIPEGMEIDHLCSNRACCNPAHLEAVTPTENNHRTLERRYGAKRGHCRHGHAYTPANTYWHGKQGHCRTCRSAAFRRRDEKRAQRRKDAA